MATAHKGNKKAVELLKGRFKDDIDSKVAKYINSLDMDIMPKESKKQEDAFMELMSNDLLEAKQKERNSKTSPKNNIIHLGKLSESKKNKLIKVKIAASILMYAFVLFGFLFSVYILTQGYGAILSIIMFVVSTGFAAAFGFIKTFISVILDE